MKDRGMKSAAKKRTCPTPNPDQATSGHFSKRRLRSGPFVGIAVLLVVPVRVCSEPEIGSKWDDLLPHWSVVDRVRFTDLAMPGMAICCSCALARVLHNTPKTGR